jgi:hypothetical protein
MRLRTLSPLLFCATLGCQAEIVVDGPSPDLGSVEHPDLAQKHPGDLAMKAAPDLALIDDATVVSATLPSAMTAGDQFSAQVKVHNAGTSTWTHAAGYKLGAVGDMDSFAATRVELPDGIDVAPGDDYSFTIAMTAPMQAGDYDTNWQMVHENVRWFGAMAGQKISVAALPADLAGVTIENSPDVSGWAATAKITTLDLGPNGVYINFTKRDGDGSWPDVPFGMPGDSLEYTLWIVLNIDGNWYASGCIEYWRGLDRNGGPPSGYAMNWYYDANRWGAMTGHQPAVGETVGFLVSAGDARNNGNTLVQERSNVVFVKFPDDNGAVFNF